MPLPKKTALSPEEQIKAAYLHLVAGLEQQFIASHIFDGVNIGRVNEACKAVKAAVTPRRKRAPRLVRPAPKLLLVDRKGG